jgi:hypothetical protein
VDLINSLNTVESASFLITLILLFGLFKLVIEFFKDLGRIIYFIVKVIKRMKKRDII